jgi:hypothetical protein
MPQHITNPARGEAAGFNCSLQGNKRRSLDNHVSRARQAAIGDLPCAHVGEAPRIAATKASPAVANVAFGDEIGAERGIKIAIYHLTEAAVASPQRQAAKAAPVIGDAPQ